MKTRDRKLGKDETHSNSWESSHTSHSIICMHANFMFLYKFFYFGYFLFECVCCNKSPRDMVVACVVNL